MKVFYSRKMVPKGDTPSSFSPSATKPALVVRDWLDRGLIDEDDVMPIVAAKLDEIAMAHSYGFIKGVMGGKIENGFGTTCPQIAKTLRFTTGSMIDAARYAIQHGEHVCSPTSGFHHAGFHRAGAYCTFNGLVIAARRMKQDRFNRRVLILDCDMHYGDGTQELIDRHGLGWIDHLTMGKNFHKRSDAGPGGRYYLDTIESFLFAHLHTADLVLYQAGADPHVQDPLGGLLTTDEMLERDRLVFKLCQGKPLVWNLAGGYQRDASGGIGPVLELHRNTLTACKDAQHERV